MTDSITSAGIKLLAERLDISIMKFDSYIRQAKEPQLREEFQKMSASLKNQRNSLLEVAEGKNDN